MLADLFENVLRARGSVRLIIGGSICGRLRRSGRANLALSCCYVDGFALRCAGVQWQSRAAFSAPLDPSTIQLQFGISRSYLCECFVDNPLERFRNVGREPN